MGFYTGGVLSGGVLSKWGFNTGGVLLGGVLSKWGLVQVVFC